MNSIDEFSIRTNGGEAQRRIEALYRTGSSDVVHGSGSDMGALGPRRHDRTSVTLDRLDVMLLARLVEGDRATRPSDAEAPAKSTSQPSEPPPKS